MANTISASQKVKLNKMNKAAQLVGLGDLLKGAPISGSVLVTQAMATGSAVTIGTPLSAIAGMNVTLRRSGSSLPYIYSIASGSQITVTAVTGGSILASDVVTWMAF